MGKLETYLDVHDTLARAWVFRFFAVRQGRSLRAVFFHVLVVWRKDHFRLVLCHHMCRCGMSAPHNLYKFASLTVLLRFKRTLILPSASPTAPVQTTTDSTTQLVQHGANSMIIPKRARLLSTTTLLQNKLYAINIAHQHVTTAVTLT